MRIEPFMEGTKFFNISDMETGPDGRLYFVEYGTGWFSKNDNSSLSVIDFNVGNRPPEAGLRIDKTSGSTPLTVSLDAGDLSDPDHDPLEYVWLIGAKQVASKSTPQCIPELKKEEQ